jgi:hypothetical protein
VLHERLIPPGWGLVSVGTGKPKVIVPAPKHRPAERVSGFTLSLLAAATRRDARTDTDAPLVEVVRPFLSRGHVGLGCHHAALSLAKTTPTKLPCMGCKNGRPTDPEAIEAAIADADPEELERYAALCAARRAA